MDGLSQKIVEILQKIEDGIPSAASLTLKLAEGYVKVDALQHIVTGIGFIIASLILIFVTFPLIKWAKSITETHSTDGSQYALPVITGCVSIICFVTGIYNLCNVWYWIAFSHPEIVLTKNVIEKVLNK